MERLPYALSLAYCGAPYAGWQRQADRPSVQAVLETALAQLGLAVSLAAAARTDAGVHARRQVVSFRVRQVLDTAALLTALQAALPRSIRALALRPAPPSFHARSSAHLREYRYRVRFSPEQSRGSWSVPDPRSLPAIPPRLDVGASRAFLAAQLGLRDRSPFTTRGGPPHLTTLTVAEVAELAGRRWVLRFVGSGFTRHLVRNLSWAAVAAGCGLPVGFETARGWKGPRAPARALVLWSVGYDPDPFAAPPHNARSSPASGAQKSFSQA